MGLRFLKRYLPGGGVQDLTQQAMGTTQPALLQPVDTTPTPFSAASQARIAAYPEIYGQQGLVNTTPISSSSWQGFNAPDVGRENASLQQYVSMNTPLGAYPVGQDVSGGAGGASVNNNNTTNNNDEDKGGSSVRRSQDGNPFTSMTSPYFATDLNSRAMSLGRSIGRAGTFGALRDNAETPGQRAAANVGQGANIAQGVLQGLSFALGTGRQIASAASEERARMQDLASYRQKMREEQLDQFKQYAGGGRVRTKDGGKFDISSLTGEYIYPLPGQMEDQANVEIEKGEYVLEPDVVAPREALGKKHSDGGTKVSLPDAMIISDYRELGDDYAAILRRRYGIRVTGKSTYASALDKYKEKIGLKGKYDEQEKILERIKRADEVKDPATRRLNKSVLSKYLSENQSEVDSMEESFRSFADEVYAAQEAAKHKADVDGLFRDGGPIDKKKFKQSLKASGLPEEEAREIVWKLYRDRLKKMPTGGPTDDEAKAFADAYRRLYGRGADFRIVDVEGAEDILNPGTWVTDEQGLQHLQGVGYGRARAKESMDRLFDLNRWGRQYYNNGEMDVLGFQRGYNTQTAMAGALQRAGLFSGDERSASAAEDFARNYGFSGEPGPLVPNGATNSKALDDKYGQYTATRSLYSLDILTPEEKKRLNDAGIRNFSDLWRDEDAAKKALDDDASWQRLSELHNMAGFGDMDFVMESHTPRAETPAEEVPAPVQRGPITPPTPQGDEEEGTWVDPRGNNQSQDEDGNTGYTPAAGGLAFPEVLRAASNGIVFPGMLRAPQARVDPVLESPDLYMNETNRQMRAQIDALGEVSGQQRAAILTNLNAQAAGATAQQINATNYRNTQARESARQFNENARVEARTMDNAYRNRYETDALTAVSLADENYRRYLDSLNSEAQQKWNAATSLNTIRALAPDWTITPSGQMVYAGGAPIADGAWSNAWLAREMARDNGSAKKSKSDLYRALWWASLWNNDR